MFGKEVYIERRRTLVGKMALTAPEGKRGIALFVGNVEAAAQYKDNPYKFRQDSSWLYYFGLDEPWMAAVIDLDRRPLPEPSVLSAALYLVILFSFLIMISISGLPAFLM